MLAMKVKSVKFRKIFINKQQSIKNLVGEAEDEMITMKEIDELPNIVKTRD